MSIFRHFWAHTVYDDSKSSKSWILFLLFLLGIFLMKAEDRDENRKNRLFAIVENYESPEIIAVETGNMERISYHLSRGVAPYTRRRDGMTLFHIAAANGNLEVMKLLVQHCSGVDVTDSQGMTPLMVAVEKGRDDVARFLMENRASLNCMTRGGKNLLHCAAVSGNASLIDELLGKGFDPNSHCGRAEWTALHLAAQNGHLHAVKVLIKYGADFSRRLSYGWLPVDLARGKHHEEVVGFLEEVAASPELPEIKFTPEEENR